MSAAAIFFISLQMILRSAFCSGMNKCTGGPIQLINELYWSLKGFQGTLKNLLEECT